MLIAYKEQLKDKKIFLCSQSKARKALLEQMNLTFSVYPSTFEENLDKASFADPKDYVRETCHGKVKDVMNKFKQDGVEWDFAIFCDTIVVVDGKIIEKPESSEEAASFLRLFNNKAQEVLTACFLLTKNSADNSIDEQSLVDCCRVFFGHIPEQSIVAYSNTDHYKGKAGGYGIQDIGITFVDRIEGSYSTVIGLPVHQLCTMFIKSLEKQN